MLLPVLAAVLVAAVAGCSAQPERLPADVLALSPDGAEVRVSSLFGRPVALVFYRHYG